MNTIYPRTVLFLAGVLGATGVALSAVAAHGGDPRLIGAAATVCMAQAPALLGLYIGYRKLRTALIASLFIGLGCLLFVCDLLVRTRFGHGLFPMSAPTGGTMMIIGWITIAAGAFVSEKAG
jgi:uncharacterized membrane protein YgdD (TMEM256/DUF423 family)